MSTLAFQTRQDKIATSLRVFLSLMFLFSAFSKLYPSPNFALTTFEVKQLYPMGFSPGFSAWLSRSLIGGEFALGILLLLPYYFRKLIIPASVALLVIFTAHLSYEYATKGNEENCGCFGTLMPFSTLESIIKNIVFLGLFAWLWAATKGQEDRKTIWPVLTMKFGAIMLVFMLGMKVAGSAPQSNEEPVVEVEDTTTTNVPIDTAKTVVTDVKTPAADTVKVEVKDEPKQTKSGYKAQYADIDKGRKILCFFAPGCDHCRETIKELTEIKKQVKDFPELKILFMDEEVELIPDFFAQAGGKYTYKVLDIATFYTVMGAKNDTPAVFYIWNGKVIKSYSGTEDRKFNAKEFKTLIQKKYSEIK